MTTLLRLHYAPDNASLCVRLMLEELGIPYETALVDRGKNAQSSDAYIALNPNGLIPVLETPQGVLFETGAILLWLADRHQKFAPAPDAPERGETLKWLFWLANSLHPALRMLFYPEKYSPDPVALRQATKDRIHALLKIFEKDAPLETPSVLTLYCVPMLRWLALYPVNESDWFDLTAYPRLLDMCRTLEVRPSALAAVQAEGLGPTPFSNPRLPAPPEGSAL